MPTEKLLVLGGNGYVGSHICKEALSRGFTVASLSRSGRSSIKESWADNVIWNQGDLFTTDSLADAFKGVTCVISCIGGFGSNEEMVKINGTANINAIRAASEAGVKRFVYISAADYGAINNVVKGYFEGKRATEKELQTKYPDAGVILRPGFIYKSVLCSPFETVLQHTKLLTKIPLIGPLFFTPPVSASEVAQVVVKAATDHAFPPGIVDVYDIYRHSQEK